MEWNLFFIATLAAAYIASIVICFRKGKPVFGAIGIAGAVFFPIIFVFGWFPVIGAIRIAKPDSAWARTRYTPEQVVAARRRFPAQQTVEPARTSPAESVASLSQTATIKEFLADALDRGALDETTYRRLRELLESSQTSPVEPEPASELIASTSSLDTPIGDELPTDTATPPVGIPPLPPQPQPEPPSPAPSVPSPAYTRLAGIREAISSDLSLHGFAYLGVLVTFVGILGFLLFAFADFPDAAQPFVELAIVLAFFGWAWFLRRQNAGFMASAMELMGGMVLPLVVFAGLVDDAPFPPDFEEGALVAAMTVSSLALAAVYSWIVRRNPTSTLRFLVAPLVWLAAMTAGFVFKTDEPLQSDAITRLVSHQPALASVAIATTVMLARWKARHPLSAPTARSGLVGVLAAYLITVSLSVGESWTSTIPMVILGVGTLLSAEALGRWYRRTDLLALARPALLAALLLPLAPPLGAHWAGLAGAVGYLVLTEATLQARGPTRYATAISAAGAVASASISFTDPRASLAAFTILSVWAHVRRVRSDTPAGSVEAFTVAAVLLPIPVGTSLLALIEPGWAWLTMAVIVALISAGVRIRASDDIFWHYWLTGAAATISIISYLTVPPSGQLVAALAVATAAVSIEPAWPVVRTWVGTALGSLTLAVTMQAFDLSPSWQAVTWAGAGFLLIFASVVWGQRPAGHVALGGHLMGAAAAFLPADGWHRVSVLGLWAAGWVVSTVASEWSRESLTGLIQRAAEKAQMPARIAAAASWIVPLAAVTTTPAAILAAANQLDEFAAHRSWTGIAVAAVALSYALMARLIRHRMPLARILTVASTVAGAIGVSVAAPDEWPTALAASAVIVAAFLLTPEVRDSWFVWFAWLMSGVVAVAGASIAGVPFDDLHLVVLSWGGAMMLGGLLVDDIRAGRRRVGEGLRIRWVRYPVMIGALATPFGLGPVFAEDPSVFGWWSLGAAALYFSVAYLVRMGAATGPGYALVAVGVVALSPWSFLDPSWRLVVIGAVLMLVALLADRFGDRDADPWYRWDLAPFVVGHLVGVFALAYAAGNEQLFATAGAFGLLAVAVGVWKGTPWIEAGNAMVLVSAWEAGADWLALALAATAVRGAIGVARSTGVARSYYQLIGVASGVGAWVSLVIARNWSYSQTVSYSALVFGGVALAVSALTRWWGIGRDTTLWWGSAPVLAFLFIGELTVILSAAPIDGPWLAIGLALMAVSLELVASTVSARLRYVTAPVTALAWAALAAGLNWSASTVVVGTSLAFGSLLVVLTEGLRTEPESYRSPIENSTASLRPQHVWLVLGLMGVTVATMAALVIAPAPDVWFAVAGGLGMAAVAMARGATPFGLTWLRSAAGFTGLAAFTALGAAFQITAAGITVGAVAVAVAAALVTVFLWRSSRESVWNTPLFILGMAAAFEAAIAALLSDQVERSLIAVLTVFGIQAVAYGLARSSPPIMGLAPPSIAAAFILTTVESVSGSAQWFTVPLALVLLTEVEIVRWAQSRRNNASDPVSTLVLEWAGLGLLAAPPLVEMFTTGPIHGLSAFAASLFVFGWALVTRVRRRAVAAASLALATAILLLFAAASAAAPVSAFFWIVAVGIGFSVMLVAGLVEAYRSKRGHIMLRVDQLMEGWE